MDDVTEARRSPSPGVSRAAAILSALADEPRRALGPSELSRMVGVPKSTVINLCGAMVEAGLMRRGPAGWQLGSRLAELGNAYLKSVVEVEEFHALAQALYPSAPHTVQLGVLGDGLTVVYLARHDGRVPLNLGLASEIGRSVPAHCTANGKALLAGLDGEALSRRLPNNAKLEQLTPRSIGTIAALRRELAHTRERGYAEEIGEIVEGLRCFGAAVQTPRRGDGLIAVSFTFADPSHPALATGPTELRRFSELFAERIGGSLVV
ncbi:IclR family transcriptional regulator [Streptomyces canus]|uniref:IclR family transcriptional regulator n=1 Tax=Streptomyces canus TaxID=58343 RepID=UPI0038048218